MQITQVIKKMKDAAKTTIEKVLDRINVAYAR